MVSHVTALALRTSPAASSQLLGPCVHFWFGDTLKSRSSSWENPARRRGTHRAPRNQSARASPEVPCTEDGLHGAHSAGVPGSQAPPSVPGLERGRCTPRKRTRRQEHPSCLASHDTDASGSAGARPEAQLPRSGSSGAVSLPRRLGRHAGGFRARSRALLPSPPQAAARPPVHRNASPADAVGGSGGSGGPRGRPRPGGRGHAGPSGRSFGPRKGPSSPHPVQTPTKGAHRHAHPRSLQGPLSRALERSRKQSGYVSPETALWGLSCVDERLVQEEAHLRTLLTPPSPLPEAGLEHLNTVTTTWKGPGTGLRRHPHTPAQRHVRRDVPWGLGTVLHGSQQVDSQPGAGGRGF